MLQKKKVLRGGGPPAKIRREGCGQKGKREVGGAWPINFWLGGHRPSCLPTDTFFKNIKSCDCVWWDVEYFHISYSLLCVLHIQLLNKTIRLHIG